VAGSNRFRSEYPVVKSKTAVPCELARGAGITYAQFVVTQTLGTSKPAFAVPPAEIRSPSHLHTTTVSSASKVHPSVHSRAIPGARSEGVRATSSRTGPGA
jgi:hypothetical protein